MRISVRRHGVLCLMFVASILGSLSLNSNAQATSGALVYLPLIIDADTSIESQVVTLMNQQRHLDGCNVDLTISATLNAAALSHSRDMAINNFFSHDGSDQSTMETRAVAAGYNYSMLAENIQAGAQSAQQVVNDPTMGWMQSAGHRANILNCSLHEIGIGYYFQVDDQVIAGVGGPFRYYWTADFGTALR